MPFAGRQNADRVDAWSERLVSELDASDRRAEQLASGLSPEQINWTTVRLALARIDGPHEDLRCYSHLWNAMYSAEHASSESARLDVTLGRVELVDLFLDRGADPVENGAETSATPRAWAERMGPADVLALLM